MFYYLSQFLVFIHFIVNGDLLFILSLLLISKRKVAAICTLYQSLNQFNWIFKNLPLSILCSILVCFSESLLYVD